MKVNRAFLLGVGLTAAGIILLAAGVATGEARVGVAFIVPFLVASGPITAGAVLCIMAGIFVMFFSPFVRAAEHRPEHVDVKSSSGGIIFIGPLPIVFGSDRKVATYMTAVAFAVAVLILILVLYAACA